MNKLLAALCMASVLLIVGSAGALEIATISCKQALVQMIAGVIVFGLTARELIREK